MNLREQIEKEITDKVMTKLASEKVGLAAPNPKRFEKTAFEAYSSANKFANKTTNTIVQNYRETEKAIKKMQDIHTEEYNGLQKMAKDLGLDIKDSKIGKDYLEVGSMLERYLKNASEQSIKYASIKP